MPTQTIVQTSVDLYFKDLTGERYQPISQEEEIRRFKKYFKSDKKSIRIRNSLIEPNLKFAISIALGYQGHSLGLDDLVANANLGLIKAVDEFKLSKGCKFISYAVWWIRNPIRLALRAKHIKIPINILDDINLLYNLEIELDQKGLSLDYNLDPEGYVDVMEGEAEMLPSRIIRAKEVNSLAHPSSLDAKILDADGDDFKSIVPYEGAMPDEFDMKEEISEVVDSAMEASLDKRDIQIVKAAYGFEEVDEKSRTLAVIGLRQGVSRERVRQLRNRALGKLKKHAKIPKGRKLKELGERT